MNLMKYAKNKGMTLQEYETLKNNIKNTAEAIKQNYCSMYKTDTGMYYDIKILFNTSILNDIQKFILQELKQIGFEFIENNTLFRY